MASAGYRQNIGTVESRRDSGASDINEFPTKEYSGGGGVIERLVGREMLSVRRLVNVCCEVAHALQLQL
jgi:hypothetical protein